MNGMELPFLVLGAALCAGQESWLCAEPPPISLREAEALEEVAECFREPRTPDPPRREWHWERRKVGVAVALRHRKVAIALLPTSRDAHVYMDTHMYTHAHKHRPTPQTRPYINTPVDRVESMTPNYTRNLIS